MTCIIMVFLCGHTVQIRDVIRLGRQAKPSVDGNSCPRPVLVKLATVWDERLVLVSRPKMKEFRVGRIFIRSDLSTEERARRCPQPPSSHVGSSPVSGSACTRVTPYLTFT